ncbi:MAG TPA: prolyl oligopeptidase family serine peptidase [Roseiflexaceae bacterium]|nr:prolyl oligopeptidase family serine peptidase [Roseiflexaceae bacterium]
MRIGRICCGALALAGAATLACTLLGTLSPVPALPPAAPLAIPPDLRASELRFQGGEGQALRGTVLESPASGAGRPGIVMVHGSGPGTLGSRYGEEAVAFARQGLAVLLYDKRPAPYAEPQRAYELLADDALGAVRALRAHPGVDPARVGIWGLSEGGWVAPLAAVRSDDVAFVIVVGANAMPPLQQQTWAATTALRRAGVSGSLVERAEPALYRLLADAGLFPEAYHDAAAVLRQLRQPLLALWGSDDLLTPPGENPPLFARALQQGGNQHYTLRFFEKAGHAAHQSPDGGKTQLPLLASGYAELVGSWVRDVTGGRPPSAEAPVPPRQDWPSVPVPDSARPQQALLQLAALALLVASFAYYPLVALLRWMRGRPGVAPAGVPARLLCSAGTASVVGLLVYLFSLIGSRPATIELELGPALGGRTVPWLLLQALALLTAGASFATALAWRRAGGAVPPGERVRLGVLLCGGGVFVPWAIHWGLLLP